MSCLFLSLSQFFPFHREALLAEMGVAIREDGGTLGVFSPKKVKGALCVVSLSEGDGKSGRETWMWMTVTLLPYFSVSFLGVCFIEALFYLTFCQ